MIKHRYHNYDEEVNPNATDNIPSLPTPETEYSYIRNDGEQMTFNDLRAEVDLNIMMQEMMAILIGISLSILQS